MNSPQSANVSPSEDATIITGPAITMLKTLRDASIQTCVTSPPYFDLRNYNNQPGIFDGHSECGHEWDNVRENGPSGETSAKARSKSAKCLKCGAWRGELGHEDAPEDFIRHLVSIFREVHRVLQDDGTFWLNMGDTVRKKQLLGIPWRVAFALQDDGWCLRQEIIWHKPNGLPESAPDRCARAHEHIFLLTKRSSYYFNADAIRNPASPALIKQVIEGYSGKSTKNFGDARAQDASATKSRIIQSGRRRILKMRGQADLTPSCAGRFDITKEEEQLLGSHKRSVWTVPTKPFKGGHFATFPTELIRPCIRAGSRAGDVVLDPFAGSGTTGQVALEEGRKTVLIEKNPDYLPLIHARLASVPQTLDLAA